MPTLSSIVESGYQSSTDTMRSMASADGMSADFNREYDRYAFQEEGSCEPIFMGGETRLEKFLNTMGGCARLGTRAGALLGKVATVIPDLIVGDGVNETGKNYDLRADGVLGIVAHAATDAAVTISTIPMGAAAGAAGVVVWSIQESRPHLEPEDPKEDAQKVATAIVENGVSGVGTVLGGFSGLLLGSLRLPVQIARGVISVAGGIVGAVVGFIGGLGRALFNI